jgi:hypothetical protein
MMEMMVVFGMLIHWHPEMEWERRAFSSITIISMCRAKETS